MRYKEYSHRHGKELLQVLHPNILKEIQMVLVGTDPFPHGEAKGKTAKDYIAEAFVYYGWEKEASAGDGNRVSKSS